MSGSCNKAERRPKDIQAYRRGAVHKKEADHTGFPPICLLLFFRLHISHFSLFLRATSQGDMLACPFGDCRTSWTVRCPALARHLRNRYVFMHIPGMSQGPGTHVRSGGGAPKIFRRIGGVPTVRYPANVCSHKRGSHLPDVSHQKKQIIQAFLLYVCFFFMF